MVSQQGGLHNNYLGVCWYSSWLLNSSGQLLDRDKTKVHRLIRVEFDAVFFNVTVEGSLHVVGLGIKVEGNPGGVGVAHKETIITGGSSYG